MLPVERGRHCQRCSKTVVDFTGMGDEEVIAFFRARAAGGAGGAGGVGGVSGVCGRLMPDQLGRDLAPAPVQRNGWKGWNLILAGALVLGKAPEGGRPVKAVVEASQRHGLKVFKKIDTSFDSVMSGGIEAIVEQGDAAVEIVPDTGVAASQGVIGESPDTATLSPDTVAAIVKPRDTAFIGDVVTIPGTVLAVWDFSDTAETVVVDSVAPLNEAGEAAETREAPETTAPQELVTIYPNPVLRGGMVKLAWNIGSGRYQVALISARGTLVQEQMITVAGKGQVAEWAMPAQLAAGVYFIRIARAGMPPVTRELLVE